MSKLSKGQIIDNKYSVSFFLKKGSYAETYRVQNEAKETKLLKLFDFAKLHRTQFTESSEILEIEILKGGFNYPQDATFVDLFVGSGLLSHFVKQNNPSAKVVYNDYDNYFERLKHIPATNVLLAELRTILADWPKDKRITDATRDRVLSCVEQADSKGFVDYVTLSSSLLFSMCYVTDLKGLKAATLYNVVRMSDYNADGYLTGVERVSLDYKALYEQYKENKNVVFLVDPPYLSTEVGVYKSYWKLKDYLDVLQVLDNRPYVYFTSNKSNIIELCDWIGSKTSIANPFTGATTKTVNVTMNYSSTYTNMILYK